MIVPLALPAHAISNEYTLFVKCDNYSGLESDTITLTFLGHTATTSCAHVDGISTTTVHFFTFASGLFHVSSSTAGTSHSALGYFSSVSCYVEGVSYSPDFGSYVEWEISSSYCHFG